MTATTVFYFLDITGQVQIGTHRSCGSMHKTGTISSENSSLEEVDGHKSLLLAKDLWATGRISFL